MKRRSFIKKGAAGLTFLAVGAVRAGDKCDTEKKRRVFGVPDSVRRTTPAERNLIRYSLARTDLPPMVWDEMVALGLLARDVFDDPGVAQAFSRDPGGYLESIGLPEVGLDPNTAEVKAALALGDPGVRRALERDDPAEFLRVLEDRGLLRNPEPSQLAAELTRHIERVEALTVGGTTAESCSAVVVCAALALATVWVWVLLIQDVAAAVNVGALATVTVSVLVYTSTITPKYMVPESGLLRRQTPFLLATALGGDRFADRSASLFIDRYVERIAAAVESLSIYRNRPPVPGPDLRSLIRGHLLRQLSAQAVSVPRSER
jgi:hypothetical protein